MLLHVRQDMFKNNSKTEWYSSVEATKIKLATVRGSKDIHSTSAWQLGDYKKRKLYGYPWLFIRNKCSSRPKNIATTRNPRNPTTEYKVSCYNMLYTRKAKYMPNTHTTEPHRKQSVWLRKIHLLFLGTFPLKRWTSLRRMNPMAIAPLTPITM